MVDMEAGQKRDYRREHFLPQFLLKGFASRVSGREYYVFQFRRGREPHEVNIKNVAAPRNFYRAPNTTDVEHTLSRREAEYARVVANVRAGLIRADDQPIIAEFIAHLIARGKHGRDALSEMAAMSLDIIERAMTSPDNRPHLRRIAETKVQAHPDLARIVRALPPAQRAVALAWLDAFTANFDYAGMAERFLKLAKENLNVSEIVKGSQIRALEQLDVAAKRRGDLESLIWSVRQQRRGTLVLGDVGPLARFADAPDVVAPIRGGRGLKAIYVPVSSDVLLVGMPNGETEDVDPERLNLVSVELSREFFISGQDSAREREYLRRLGIRAALLDESEIARMVKEGMEEGWGVVNKQ